MKYLYLLLVMASVAAGAMEPGSQYKPLAEAGDPRAQYYLADTYVSFGDFPQAEYWAQKAADKGDGDALALLAQLKIRNPQQADYRQAKALAEVGADRQQGGRNCPRPGAGEPAGRYAELSARHLPVTACRPGSGKRFSRRRPDAAGADLRQRRSSPGR